MLAEAAIFLTAAVIAVPLSRRLGLGAVLGYLVAGIVIGPAVLGFVIKVNDILHFAEFGVVLLLFVIGLELQPSAPVDAARPVFGLGERAGAGHRRDPGRHGGWPSASRRCLALVIGLTLSLSSTAFALQMLAEKKPAHHAPRPRRVLHPAVPGPRRHPAAGRRCRCSAAGARRRGRRLAQAGAAQRRASPRSCSAAAAAALLVCAWSLRPHIREVFTATALLVVVGIALLMQPVGLSMALGAFLAGVLLADSRIPPRAGSRHRAVQGPAAGPVLHRRRHVASTSALVHRAAARWSRRSSLGLIAIKAAVLYVHRAARAHDPARRGDLALIHLAGRRVRLRHLRRRGRRAACIDAPLSDLLIVVVTLSHGAHAAACRR